jgi:hypothetical protein
MTAQSRLKTGRRTRTWYTARVLYRCDIRSKRPRKIHTFEELYFLASGLTPGEALQKAKKIAKQKEHSYRNMYGESVSWRLARFLGIQETTDQEIKDGAEVYFRFLKGLKSRVRKIS